MATKKATFSRQQIIDVIAKYREEYDWCENGVAEICEELGIDRSEVPNPPDEVTKRVSFVLEFVRPEELAYTVAENLVLDDALQKIQEVFVGAVEDVVYQKAQGRRKPKTLQYTVTAVYDVF